MSGVKPCSSEVVQTADALARRGRVKALWAQVARRISEKSEAELEHLLDVEPQTVELWLDTFAEFAIEARNEAAYWDNVIKQIAEVRYTKHH